MNKITEIKQEIDILNQRIAVLANTAAEQWINEVNDKLAFPWICWSCGKQGRGEPAKRGAFGPLCKECYITQ